MAWPRGDAAAIGRVQRLGVAKASVGCTGSERGVAECGVGVVCVCPAWGCSPSWAQHDAAAAIQNYFHFVENEAPCDAFLGNAR